MNLRVRVRPHTTQLSFLAAAVLITILGSTTFDGVLGEIVTAFGSVLTIIVVAPIVVSTIFRVPALIVNPDGLRLPLMGVRLPWSGIARVRQAPGPARTVLLIVPNDPQSAVRQMFPWLRSEGRASVARYGTPIVMASIGFDKTVDEIEAAVAHFRPAAD